MKKIIYISIILLLCNTIAYSQTNLVPNPSFENYTQCPDGPSQLHRLTDWFNPSAGTADFYNSCFTTGGANMGVPNNSFGSQSTTSGNGYIGLFIHYYYTLYREYAEVKLTDSLIEGNKYYVSFSVSLADSSNFATDDIAIHFSNDSLLNYFSFDNFSVTPHVENTQGDFLSDKSIWYFISGEYTASGGENFLTIGNFKNDTNTDTISVPQGGNMTNDYFCYYYIDNICVSSSANTCGIVGINEVFQEGISIFPNPSNGLMTLSTGKIIESFSVYSSLGQLILNCTPNSQTSQIDLSKYATGVYFFHIKTKTKSFNYKLLKL